MINKSLKAMDLVSIDWSKSDGHAILTVDVPEGLKKEDWSGSFNRCQAVIDDETGNLVVTCEKEPETKEKMPKDKEAEKRIEDSVGIWDNMVGI